MSTVFLSPAAFQDFVRLEPFLFESEDPLAGELLDFILDALQVLTYQPGMGRPVEGGCVNWSSPAGAASVWRARHGSLCWTGSWWHGFGTSAKRVIKMMKFER